MHKILPTLLIFSLGPASLGVPDPKPVMVFDVRRVPTVGEMIVTEASRQGVPPHMALAVAWRESKFQTGARHVNIGGSVDSGLFQLNSRWHPDAAAMSVEENIAAGVGVIAEKVRRCGTDYGPTIRRAYTTGRCK